MLTVVGINTDEQLTNSSPGANIGYGVNIKFPKDYVPLDLTAVLGFP